ncbi:MAG: hypothetical protein AAGB34_09380, partial [Planctomycetota bacterium]
MQISQGGQALPITDSGCGLASGQFEFTNQVVNDALTFASACNGTATQPMATQGEISLRPDHRTHFEGDTVVSLLPGDIEDIYITGCEIDTTGLNAEIEMLSPGSNAKLVDATESFVDVVALGAADRKIRVAGLSENGHARVKIFDPNDPTVTIASIEVFIGGLYLVSYGQVATFMPEPAPGQDDLRLRDPSAPASTDPLGFDPYGSGTAGARLGVPQHIYDHVRENFPTRNQVIQVRLINYLGNPKKGRPVGVLMPSGSAIRAIRAASGEVNGLADTETLAFNERGTEESIQENHDQFTFVETDDTGAAWFTFAADRDAVIDHLNELSQQGHIVHPGGEGGISGFGVNIMVGDLVKRIDEGGGVDSVQLDLLQDQLLTRTGTSSAKHLLPGEIRTFWQSGSTMITDLAISMDDGTLSDVDTLGINVHHEAVVTDHIHHEMTLTMILRPNGVADTIVEVEEYDQNGDVVTRQVPIHSDLFYDAEHNPDLRGPTDLYPVFANSLELANNGYNGYILDAPVFELIDFGADLGTADEDDVLAALAGGMEVTWEVVKLALSLSPLSIAVDSYDLFIEMVWKPEVLGEDPNWFVVGGALVGIAADAGWLIPAAGVGVGITGNAIALTLKLVGKALDIVDPKLLKAMKDQSANMLEYIQGLYDLVAKSVVDRAIELTTDSAQTVAGWVSTIFTKLQSSPLGRFAATTDEWLSTAGKSVPNLNSLTRRALGPEAFEGYTVYLLKHGGDTAVTKIDDLYAKIAARTAAEGTKVADDALEGILEAIGRYYKSLPGTATVDDIALATRRIDEGIAAAGRGLTGPARLQIQSLFGPDKVIKSMEEFEVLRFLPAEALTSAQRAAMQLARDQIANPPLNYPVQKVMSLNTVQFNPFDMLRDGTDTIGGFFGRLDEFPGSAAGAKALDDRYRLVGPGSPFSDTESYAVIRTRMSQDMVNKTDVPRTPDYGGNLDPASWMYPNTHNAWSASRDGTLPPEWRLNGG